MVMSGIVARICGIALGLFAAAPALAQEQPAGHPSDVVVNGQVGKRSDWKRAETDHAIIYSQGSADELKRIARNIELLHALMTRLYVQHATSDDAAKVVITLLPSRDALDAMKLGNARFQEGPFEKGFPDDLYYDPRPAGTVLAVGRSDQRIDLDTHLRASKDCDEYIANGGFEGCGPQIAQQQNQRDAFAPISWPWEGVLYGAYAQHFLQTYVPAPYPRWYLDGIAALFSTIAVKGDGSMDYACPPDHFKQVLLSYGNPDVRAILTGSYLADPKAQANWSPYSAWLLTHYFVFNTLRPERHAQFQQYMAAIARGKSMAEAATVFGSMVRLQREVNGYVDATISEAHAKPPATPLPDPLIATLTPEEGALVTARLGLDTRLAATGTGMDWSAQVGGAGDPGALLYVAEAQCRSGAAADCLATANRVLAASPDDARALTWKGVAQTVQAITGPDADRPARLAEARATLQHAIALDGTAPTPRIAYFQSFTKAGEIAPPDAISGMTAVIRAVPAAPAPRLYLSRELVRQGQPDVARRLVYPILYGAYDSPERAAAQALFAAAR